MLHPFVALAREDDSESSHGDRGKGRECEIEKKLVLRVLLVQKRRQRCVCRFVGEAQVDDDVRPVVLADLDLVREDRQAAGAARTALPPLRTVYPLALLLFLDLALRFLPLLPQGFLVALIGALDFAKIVGDLLVECPRLDLAFRAGGIPIRQLRLLCRTTHGVPPSRKIAAQLLDGSIEKQGIDAMYRSRSARMRKCFGRWSQHLG